MREYFAQQEFDLNDFSVVYQPIYDIRTSEIEKIEALLRWTKSSDVEAFIRHFESTGQINTLTLFVVESVCADLKKINMAWHHPVVAINFAPGALANSAIVSKFIQMLASHGIPPHWIEIEITETWQFLTPLIIEGAFTFVQNGFKISLDDFGVGSTSLSCLTKLPVGVLKIDRSFISRINQCFVTRSILSAIAHLQHEMGIGCIAEGIETQEQEDFMERLGIKHAQGFMFSKPLVLNDLIRLLLKYKNMEMLAWAQI